MIKKMYTLSNKKDVQEQFARQEHQCTLLRWQVSQELPDMDLQDLDVLPTLHHLMASQAWKDNTFSLPLFLSEHANDPAIEVSESVVHTSHSHLHASQPSFMRCLKDPMLSRLHNLDFDGDEHSFTPKQRNELQLLNLDHVVESKILQINYTTYDICRAYDCLWPSHLSFLMTLSREDDPASGNQWEFDKALAIIFMYAMCILMHHSDVKSDQVRFLRT